MHIYLYIYVYMCTVQTMSSRAQAPHRSCCNLELFLPLLEEAHDLVSRSDSRIVVGFERLSAHLLLCEDGALHIFVADQLLNLLRIRRSHIAEVAEVWLFCEHLRQLLLVHDFLTGGVDEGTTL